MSDEDTIFLEGEGTAHSLNRLWKGALSNPVLFEDLEEKMFSWLEAAL